MRYPRHLLCALALGLTLPCAAAGWPASAGGHARALTAEQAFQLLPPTRHGDTVQLEWSIAPGYFLYRDRIQVRAGDRPVTLKLPAAQRYDEPGAGTVQIYRDDLKLRLRAPAGTVLQVRYQGCSDQGICYPPQTHRYPLQNH